LSLIVGVLIGVVVAVVVQFVVGLYVRPAIELREAIWAVDHSIILFENSYGQLAPDQRKIEAQHKFRNHSGELSSKSRALIGHRFWSMCGLIPERSNILKASQKLIFLAGLTRDLSNDAGMNASTAESEIRKLLHIEPA